MIQIDGNRLNASLQELARIGATPGGGVTRLTLSDEDKAARDLLARWMTAAGLEVRIDDFGNMSGIRPGTEDAPPVYLGSHIDTVVRGGRYDGALGVMGGLEVIRTLNDHNVQTRLPVSIVNWTNEEGVRFEPATLCSGAIAGAFTRDYVYGIRDRHGYVFREELERIGYLGDESNRPLPASAYLELHIEQGPVLEAAGKPVGVVGGIVGIIWSEVVVTGQSDHAGPSPMPLRKDALMAASTMIASIEKLALDRDDVAVATVGRIRVEPDTINTIPGKAVFSVDFRHPDGETIEALSTDLNRLGESIGRARGVDITVERIWTSTPTPFDPTVVDAIRIACQRLDLPYEEFWSGAGHDAKHLADLVPSGMIFVRSEAGVSHAEIEHSTSEDITAGGNVLLHTALQLAG
ncbi:MAG: Zn-dependent hydrolase [Thermomicrobiales bacterium]|nr:Zn-dependent hydrolase [Thermomicrobiales bacterium]